MPETIGNVFSPEFALQQTLGKLDLTRAGFAQQPVEVGLNEVANPALGNGPNGYPQRLETKPELAARALSTETAAANFPRFALIFALALDRGSKMVSGDVVETGVKASAEAAGLNVRFRDSSEANLLDGIYYAHMYARAMGGSDNAPGNFLKALEEVAGPVEDFRLNISQTLEVLNQYPRARWTFLYLTNFRVIYELQNNMVGPNLVPIDPALEFETQVLANIRAGNAINRRGGALVIPAAPPNELLVYEEEAHLGYALFEALGFRDAFQHRRILNPAPGVYRPSTTEEARHILGKNEVADPFSSIAKASEFVQGVKQRFGVEIGKEIGIDTLDIGWRTYGAEIVTRAAANSVSCWQEMINEKALQASMEAGLPVAYSPGTFIGGRNVVGQAIPYEETDGFYPENTIINGFSVGGREIAVNMIRNYKKFAKGNALFGTLFGLLLNPFGDPKEALTKCLDASAEYAREAFKAKPTTRQREQVIPKITDVIMNIAKKRGMPVDGATIQRYIRSQQTDLGMYKEPVVGGVKSLWQEMKMSAAAEHGNVLAEKISPKQGGVSPLANFVKTFFGEK